jgi:hypothetical protein
VVYRDAFDGATLDEATWEKSNPLNGSTVSQENGELVTTSDGTNGYFCANPNGWTPGQGVALRQRVSGDFDIQVDFRDFSGVGAVYFNVYQDSSNELQIKRDRNPDGRDYLQTFVVVTGTPIDGTYSDNEATAGTFRIMRTGNTIHTFFDGTHQYSVDAFGGPVLIAMVLGSPGSEWETPRVVFDNFVIYSGTLDPIETCPVPVAIDIKPGSDRNSINLGSAGVVPVAILSSPTFDAQDVNPDTLVLASARVKLIRKGGKYSCRAVDVNGDGLPDLLCHVVTAQFALQPGDTVAVLDAVTHSGQRVRGQDSIRIVP